MTEGEWLIGVDPKAMLSVVTRNRRNEPMEAVRMASDRQLRLFGLNLYLAYLKLMKVYHYKSDKDYAWIDGAGEKPLSWNLTIMDPCHFAFKSIDGYTSFDKYAKYEYRMVPVRQACEMLRDLVGNPYRNRILDSHWITPDVSMLATAAYENIGDDGVLEPLTLLALADALEERGCDVGTECRECVQYGRQQVWEFLACHRSPSIRIGGEILSTLRSPSAKYRGLWPVDLILQKR